MEAKEGKARLLSEVRLNALHAVDGHILAGASHFEHFFREEVGEDKPHRFVREEARPENVFLPRHRMDQAHYSVRKQAKLLVINI